MKHCYMKKNRANRSLRLAPKGKKLGKWFFSFLLMFVLSNPTFSQTYTFTPAGATGQNGPTQSQLNTEYANTPLAGQVTSVNGIQYWVVPRTGLYKLEAYGAQGFGTYGGRGAYIKGDFILQKGDTLKILVGQKAPPPVNSNNQYAGGGGSFITYSDNTPLIVAGGGGGSWATSFTSVSDASTSNGGNKASNAVNMGNGGTNGSGGETAGSADGGGGLTGDGGGTGGGIAFINGGIGGKGTSSGHGEGGFGGGGGTSSWDNYRCGGGGGYSGGGGAGQTSQAGNPEAGGGGSFNSGINQVNQAGIRTGDGSIVISSLSTGARNDAGIFTIDAPLVFCPGNNDIIVTAVNLGGNIINNVLINYRINGANQSPILYTGTLDTVGGNGSFYAQINLGAYRFDTSVYDLEVWTSQPNGGTDTVSRNDTAYSKVQANLSSPTQLRSSNVSSTSATIRWNAGNPNNRFAYHVSPFEGYPTSPGTTVQTDSVQLSGLVRGTTYYVYVREICNTGDSSAWEGPLSFRTECGGALSGNYTVNPALALSSSNFISLTDALLNLAECGVSGPVTINLAPNIGPFTGGVELGAINGASATNTITLNGNGNEVNEGSTTYILALNGVSYLTINNFRFINTDPTSPLFGIMIRGESKYVNITNNYIDAGMEYTSTAGAPIAMSATTTSATSTGNNGQYMTITGNELVGGYYGITLIGQSSYSMNYGHLVANNIVRDYYVYGIYLSNADTSTVRNNELNRLQRQTVSTFYGVYLSTSRNIKILSNEIHSSGSGSYTAYPIYITTSVNSSGFETEIINNKIYNIPTTGTLYGIYGLGTREHIKVLHNTIDLNSSGSGAKRNIFFSTAPNNHTLRNNILSMRGDGTGIKYNIYITTTSTSFSSDYNVLYMGATAGTNHTGYWTANRSTLALWQTNASQDANSLDLNPFLSNPDIGNLIPLSTAIDNKGTSVGVSQDFNGNTRSGSTPDIGAFEFTGLSNDIMLLSAELLHENLCYNNYDTASFTIKNIFGTNVNFATDSLRLVWNLTGPVNSSGSFWINSGTLAPDSIRTVFIYNAVMSQPGKYSLKAYIEPNARNESRMNDTLVNPVEFTIESLLSATPRTITFESYGDSVDVSLNSPAIPAGQFFITEVCHFKTTNGAPTGGWPSYLLADDYIEITGVPNSDLGGITLEQWTTTLQSSYTFPAGTKLSPNGTAVIAVGQLGSSTESPSDFFYIGTGSYTGTFGSTTTAGRILKNSSGVIIDAVVYGTYTFPAAAGVTTSDWSGSTPSVSSSGNRLMGAYTKDATNWVNSGTAGGSPLQDPNTLNSGVTLPQPPNVSGITWTKNGNVIDTTTSIQVGPFSNHGTHTYIASFTNTCGTFYDTVTVIVPPINDLSTEVILPSTITCGNDLPIQVILRNEATEAINFAVDNAAISVNVSGASTQTLNTNLTNNSLNGNQALAPGDSIILNMGLLNIDATGTYHIVANVTVNGDLDSTNNQSATQSFTLNSIANAGDDLLVCSGVASPTALGGSPTAIGGKAPYNYSWSPAGLLNNASIANPTATVTTNTLFTLRVTDSLGCYSDDSVLVVASASPNPVISGDTQVCLGLVNYSTPFNAGTRYKWTVSGGTIVGSDSAETVQVRWTQSGIGNVRVTQTIIAGGCSTQTAPYNVTVLPNPNASLTPSGPTSFCDGGNVNLVVTPQTGYTYKWRRDNALLFGVTTHSYMANTTGNFKVFVTDANGCMDSSSAVSVTVNPIPEADFSYSGSNVFCDGDSLLLAADTGTGYSYQWFRNGTAITDATSANYAAKQTGAYAVRINNSFNCADTSQADSVFVNPVPNASITANTATTVCDGNDVELEGATTAGASYQWRINGSDITGATDSIYYALASGAYTQVVTSNAGCVEESNTINVIIHALPSSNITPGGATTFCDGDSVILTGNTSGTFTYQWFLDNNPISGAQASSYTALVGGDYTVEITDSNSCVSLSNTETVTVNALPTLSISNQNADTLCFPNTAQLSTTSVATMNYQWYKDGNILTGETTSGYTVTATGIYLLEATDANTGCQANSNSISVLVNAQPSITVNPSGPTRFCDGNSVDLVGNSNGGVSFQWYENGIAISGATTATFTASQTGIYTLETTSAEGCTNLSDADTVNVDPLPLATLTPQGATTVCSGTDVILEANTGSGLTYEWYLNNNLIPNADSSTLNAAVSGDYHVTVFSNVGCATSSSVVNVVVNPTPNPVITPNGSTTLCERDTLTLNANFVADAAYIWFKSGNQVSNSGASFQAIDSGIYTVIITDTITSCSAESSPITLNLSPRPVAMFIANDICLNVDASFTNQSTVSNGNISYSWSLGDGNTSTDENPTLTYATSGSFVVTLTATSDMGINCQSVFSDTLVVKPIPVSTFTWGYMGNNLVNFEADDKTGTSFFWDFGDDSTSTLMDVEHFYANDGNYDVTLTVVNAEGCETETTETIGLNFTGLNGAGQAFDFGVYPNPFSKDAIIGFTISENAHVKLEVFDQLGRHIMTLQDGDQLAGTHTRLLDATEIAPQTLIIRLTVNDRVYNKKAVYLR